MNTTTSQPPPAIADACCGPTDEEVVQRVRALLRGLCGRDCTLERRARRRYPYPYLVRLAPLADGEVGPPGPAIVVVGKHLSERGLGFYHPEPLAHRRMVAMLETFGDRSLSLLIDLSWCRFTGHGWYESGGRFLQVVDPSVGCVKRTIS